MRGMMDDKVIVDAMKELVDELGTVDGRTELFQPVFQGLSMLMGVQRIVSAPVPGCIPEDGMPPSKDAMRTYFMALVVELGELLQETDWKPWKDKQHIDRENIAEEFADVLAFLGVILIQLDALGVPPGVLANAYIHKTGKNVARFLGEYGEEYKQIGKYAQSRFA